MIQVCKRSGMISKTISKMQQKSLSMFGSNGMFQIVHNMYIYKKSAFCIGGWGQSRSLFHVGGSEEYSIPYYCIGLLAGRAEFTRAVMCARSDERGKWGERES